MARRKKVGKKDARKLDEERNIRAQATLFTIWNLLFWDYDQALWVGQRNDNPRLMDRIVDQLTGDGWGIPVTTHKRRDSKLPQKFISDGTQYGGTVKEYN